MSGGRSRAVALRVWRAFPVPGGLGAVGALASS